MASLFGRVKGVPETFRNQASAVSFAAPGRYQTTAFGGDNDTYMRTYAQNGTVFSIVSLLATSVASPKWNLYRCAPQDGRMRYTTADHGSDQRTQVIKHAALDLWNNPNPFMQGMEFREIVETHIELTGESYWLIDRAGGANFPTSMWPISPARMTPVPSETDFLAGYIYVGPNGEKIPLTTDEVIFMKLPHPSNPYRGLGPVQSILVDIDAVKYAAEFNRNFFINSAQPGGVITTPENLSDQEFNELSNRWREGHQGVSRSHRVAILEAGATFMPMQSSMKDMEFNTLRSTGRDLIREAWGIHKSMLGNSDDVNRANAQTAEEVFGRWKVIPRLDRMKMIVNNVLLPKFGSTGMGVEFDYENPLPDDREADNSELAAKSQAASVLILAGFDPDDVCEVVGLPSMRMVEKPTVAPGGSPPDGPMEEAANSDGEPAEDDVQGSPSPDHGQRTTNRLDMAWQTVLLDALRESQREVNN